MSKYKPAIFQPTIRPDWGGVLSYLSVEEKAKILECILKYPLVDCDSPFWIDVIKPELDSQFDSFKEVCKAKARGGKSRWEKDKDTTSITNVEDKDSISLPHGNQEDNISLPYGNLVKDKDKEKDNNNILNNNLNNNNTINKERKEKEKKDFLDKFEEFWKEYTPVKCNGKFIDKGSKKTACEKFVRILEKGEEYENIIRGTREYINHCKENGQLTCGATVFLNQERWKCDYGATINGESATQQREPHSLLEPYAELLRQYQQT